MELYGFENLTVQVGDRFGLFRVPAAGPDKGSFFDNIFRALQLRPGVTSAPVVAAKTPGTSTVTTQPSARQQLQQVTKQPTATAQGQFAQGLGKAAQVVSSGKEEIAVGVSTDVAVSEVLINALFLGGAANSNTEPSLALVAGVVIEASSGETGQVLQAAVELFSVVEHVTTTRSERTQAVEPSETGVAAVVTHLESLLGIAQQETVRPAVAQQLLQVARLMSEAMPVQALPLVSTLVLQTRSEVQLTRLVQTLDQFFRLPEAVQREIIERSPQDLHEFRRLVQQEVKTHPDVPERQAFSPGPAMTPPPVEQAVPALPAKSQPVRLVPMPQLELIRSLGRPLADLLPTLDPGRVPPREAREVRQLRDFLSSLSRAAGPLTSPRQTAMMQRNVTRFLRYVPLPAVHHFVTRGAMAYPPAVRPFVVHLIKAMLKQPQLSVDRKGLTRTLENLARSWQGLRVKTNGPAQWLEVRSENDVRILESVAEAIRVLLDMGDGQSKGRRDGAAEDIEVLLKQVDAKRLLKTLLHSKSSPEAILIGLSLLQRVGQSLPRVERRELLRSVQGLVERPKTETIFREALDCLRGFENDLELRDRMRLRTKGTFAPYMTVASQRYRRGYSDFVSNNGPQAVRYGT